ncbi:hypothetical protein AVEN_72770-1, partial [Araneus ventricosus]
LECVQKKFLIAGLLTFRGKKLHNYGAPWWGSVDHGGPGPLSFGLGLQSFRIRWNWQYGF